MVQVFQYEIFALFVAFSEHALHFGWCHISAYKLSNEHSSQTLVLSVLIEELLLLLVSLVIPHSLIYLIVYFVNYSLHDSKFI